MNIDAVIEAGKCGGQFTVKPLDWQAGKDDCCEGFIAEVPMGTYKVARYNFDDGEGWSPWKWEWSFREYYDEGASEVVSAEEGKEAAWNDWLKRITPSLELAAAPLAERVKRVREILRSQLLQRIDACDRYGDDDLLLRLPLVQARELLALLRE